jgi:hypothetical protein
MPKMACQPVRSPQSAVRKEVENQFNDFPEDDHRKSAVLPDDDTNVRNNTYGNKPSEMLCLHIVLCHGSMATSLT